MSDVAVIAKAFLELVELIKDLKPTEFEKLEKEFKNDQKKLGKAWKENDFDTVNAIFDKYYEWLFQA